MSLSSKKLTCKVCPFLDYPGRRSKYTCFLDKTILTFKNIFTKTHHIDCPLLDGKVVTIRAEGGQLIIGRDYQ